jgi:hypothetical protein
MAEASATTTNCSSSTPDGLDGLVQQLLERVQALEARTAQLEQELNSRAPSKAVTPQLPDSIAMMGTRVVMHQIVAPAEVDALGIAKGGQVGCGGWRVARTPSTPRLVPGWHRAAPGVLCTLDLHCSAPPLPRATGAVVD